MENNQINNTVASFQSTGKYFIESRGDVYTVTNDKDRDRERSGLPGNIVEIDGKKFKVKGVESFCVPKIRKGQEIVLMVEAINE